MPACSTADRADVVNTHPILECGTVKDRSGIKESIVGADAFVAFFGVKIALDPDDEETLDACGAETDKRCTAAAAVGLQTHSGRMTDGEDYFLLIGRRLAWLGLEHDPYVRVGADDMNEIQLDVKRRLRAAGFTEEPALHLQFVGQY
jgi:hypothetical protein